MEVNSSNIYIICIVECVPVFVFCCNDELLIENTTKL